VQHLLEYIELFNMSRILRRPMFRKGGPTQGMTGIMSGIEDRNNYQDAGRVGELTKQNLDLLMQSDEGNKSFDPLTTFLLQYGPALASAKPTGSLIGTAVGAAAGPIQAMLAEQAERRKYSRDIKAGATELAIKQAGEENILGQKIKAEKDLLTQRLEAETEQKGNELYNIYKDMRIQEAGGEVPGYVADNYAFYQTDYSKKMRDNLPSEQIGGLIRFNVKPDDPKSVQEWAKKNKAKINAGQIYYFSEELGTPVIWNNRTNTLDRLSLDFKEIIPGGDETEDTGVDYESGILSFEDARSIAAEKGYELIGPRPVDANRGWLADQKRKNPNAITKAELEEIIEKEKFAEIYKNVKGKSRTR
jgi:hypothetical protein